MVFYLERNHTNLFATPYWPIQYDFLRQDPSPITRRSTSASVNAVAPVPGAASAAAAASSAAAVQGARTRESHTCGF